MLRTLEHLFTSEKINYLSHGASVALVNVYNITPEQIIGYL